MSHIRFLPLAILLVAIFLLAGCGTQQMVPTLMATIPTLIPTQSPSIIPSVTFPTPQPTISQSKTQKATQSANSTKTNTPTPTFASLSSIRPGIYILINARETNPDRYETDLFTTDGTFQARLAEEGGPVSPRGKKMVIWDSYDSFIMPSCSGIRILDLESHVVTADPFPVENQGCTDLNWSPDGKNLYFLVENKIIQYNLITQKSVVLLDSSIYSSNGFGNLRISPDGKWLAFYWSIMEYGKKYLEGLYILNLACNNEPSTCKNYAYLLLNTNWTSALAWTPDGFLSRNVDTSIQIFDVTKKTLVETMWIDPGISIDKYAWSPDKKWIVYSQGEPDAIAIFPSSGGKFTYWEGIRGEVLGWLVVPTQTPVP